MPPHGLRRNETVLQLRRAHGKSGLSLGPGQRDGRPRVRANLHVLCGLCVWMFGCGLTFELCPSWGIFELFSYVSVPRRLVPRVKLSRFRNLTKLGEVRRSGNPNKLVSR